jgi:invasion protein IalB
MIAALLPLALQAVPALPAAALPAFERAAVPADGDWSVLCDNQRRCTTWARVPDGAAASAYPLVVLRRDGDAAAVPAIDLPIPAGTAPGTRLSIRVDARVLAQLVAPGGGAGLSLPFSGALARALTRGRMLTLADPGGAVRASTSLDGLAAALAAIDAAQRREGTRGALVRGGAGRVPPVPPLPAVAVPRADPRAPRVLSRKELQASFGKPPKDCGPALARGYRLDATRTLLAIEPPCATMEAGTGAGALLFVAPDKGAPQPALFDAAAALPGAPTHQVAGNWDPVRRRVAVLLPATPGQDCGTRRDFAWDGARFRMVEERVIAECRRATYEITTFRADVQSR